MLRTVMRHRITATNDLPTPMTVQPWVDDEINTIALVAEMPSAEADEIFFTSEPHRVEFPLLKTETTTNPDFIQS
jgi:hypothetical protein